MWVAYYLQFEFVSALVSPLSFREGGEIDSGLWLAPLIAVSTLFSGDIFPDMARSASSAVRQCGIPSALM